MADNEIVFRVLGDAAALKSELNNVSDAFKKVGQIAGVAFAASGLGLGLAIKAGQEAERSTRVLAQAIQNQGLEVAKVLPHLEAYAANLMQKSGVDDEQIKQIEATYLAYGLQGKALDDLTKATLDYAAATGKNIETASMVVGAAIEGATNKIRGFKLNLDSITDTETRAAMVTDALGQKFEGQAEAATKGYGSITLLKGNIGELIEAIGLQLQPVVVRITNTLNNLVYLIQSNPFLVKLATMALTATAALSGTTVAVAGLVIGMNTLIVTTIPSLIKAFKDIQAVLILSPHLSAVMITIAAIAALVAILGTIWVTNVGGIQEKTQQLVEFLKLEFGGTLNAIGSWFVKLGNDTATVFGYIWEKGKVFASGLLDILTYPIKGWIELINLGLAALGKDPIDIKAAWTSLANHIVGVWNEAGLKIAKIKDKASNPGNDNGGGMSDADRAALKYEEQLATEHQQALITIKRAGQDELGNIDTNARAQELAAMQLQFANEREDKVSKLESEREFLEQKGILSKDKAQEIRLEIDAINTDYDAREDARKNAQLQSEQTFGGRMAKLNATLNQQKVKNFSDTMGVIAGLQQSNSQTLVSIGKAAAMAAATINIAQGITQTIAWYPFPVNIALAALVGAAGAVQLANIAGVSFAVGTDFVPEDMPANIHRGEIIVPATFSDAIRSGALSLSGGSHDSTTNNSNSAVNVSVVVEGNIIGTTAEEFAIKVHEVLTEKIGGRMLNPLPSGAF
ncbi:MAG: hypothetical protein WCS77_00080 [Elusimicrobiaceae bacterium]